MLKNVASIQIQSSLQSYYSGVYTGFQGRGRDLFGTKKSEKEQQILKIGIKIIEF